MCSCEQKTPKRSTEKKKSRERSKQNGKTPSPAHLQPLKGESVAMVTREWKGGRRRGSSKGGYTLPGGADREQT